MNWKKIVFDTLESTNQTATLYPPYTVIMAKTQTAGRGRYGKNWVSPAGNLYMSAVLPDSGKYTKFYAFIVALAVVQSLSKWPVTVKWPNDVLLDGKKLAGILLEKTDNGIVAGIGVNVQTCPADGLAYEAASLNGAVSCDELATRILKNLQLNMQELAQNGFAPLREKYLTCLQGLGGTISVNLPDEKLVGIFRDLSASGALILELPDKTYKEITAGVVFLLD